MGIKETKEALALGFAIAGIIKNDLKDGFQVSDLLDVLEKLTSEENVSILKTALEGANQIPVEIQAVGLFEGIELGRFVLGEVKKLLI
jgi:hypothetical protein